MFLHAGCAWLTIHPPSLAVLFSLHLSRNTRMNYRAQWIRENLNILNLKCLLYLGFKNCCLLRKQLKLITKRPKLKRFINTLKFIIGFQLLFNNFLLKNVTFQLIEFSKKVQILSFMLTNNSW